MARTFVVAALTGLSLGFAVFAAGSIAAPASAEAFGGRYEEGWGPPRHGWRPPPPVFHGYWGRRRWHHQDAYGFRPPPPRYGYGYGHGWR